MDALTEAETVDERPGPLGITIAIVSRRLRAMSGLSVRLRVNSREHRLFPEPRRTLLDVLRNDLGLTGAKKVCDMGDCGACTVLVDRRAMYACLLLAVDCEGREITTVEGLARDGKPSALQEAFIECDALQCGFCTPGQIMALEALLLQTAAPSDDELRRAVTGNLCRCGAYPNILRAGRLAADRLAGTPADG
jgi:xanthine dehydrogenase YagT iron-sulfur-binding subunit